MKRLLLPLLAAIALPTAVNAEEFTEIKSKNIYSYKKSSLVKFNNEDGKRFISFMGTTLYTPCFAEDNPCHKAHFKKYIKNWDSLMGSLIFEYEIDWTNGTFDKKGDNLRWTYIYVDQTAVGVYQKYCPLEEWSKLPNK